MLHQREVAMAIINLRRYYPHYPKDKFIEVPDNVADALEEGRLHARYALKKKFRKIAADEGVSGSCTTESVTRAVRKLQKFFQKNGWMPKEA